MALLIGQACSNESIEKQCLENDKKLYAKALKDENKQEEEVQDDENSYGTCPLK